MAVKEKQKEKKSRIWEIITKDYKWQSYLFVVVALMTLILGILILTNVLTVKASFPILGSHPTVFAGILVAFSGISLIYALYPFFKPAWPELKKVTWPTRKSFLSDAVRVFMFLIIFALLFVLYDFFITEIWTLIVS